MAEDWTPKDNWSPNNHNHDSEYSKLEHTHDYAASGHNHDSVYSKLGHVHDYAAKDHNHDTEYSKLSHTHDDRYYTESEVNTLMAGRLRYPDYANATTLPENTTTYTATQDGWIFAYARRDATYWHVRINEIWAWATGGSSYDVGTCLLPIKSGDVVTIHKGIGNDDEDKTAYDGATLKFYPNR